MLFQSCVWQEMSHAMSEAVFSSKLFEIVLFAQLFFSQWLLTCYNMLAESLMRIYSKEFPKYSMKMRLQVYQNLQMRVTT